MPAPTKTSIMARGEIVAAAVLGVAALAAYGLQVLTLNRATSPAETALFNTLQFVLTLGFTWFSTRALSRKEFEQSLKRFAISAYRRIADIERLVNRLTTELRDMIREAPQAERPRLQIAHAIATDTSDIVRSSIADWGDVIGDELLALQTLRVLEERKEQIADAADEIARPPAAAESLLKDINDEIARLRESLPARLRVAEQLEWAEPRRQHAIDWLRREHEREGGLKWVVLVAGHGEGTSYEKVDVTTPLQVVRSTDGGLDLADMQGNALGRVRNDTPLGYPEFVRAVEGAFGTLPLSVRVVEKLSTRPGNDHVGWVRVQVLSDVASTRRDSQPFEIPPPPPIA